MKYSNHLKIVGILAVGWAAVVGFLILGDIPDNKKEWIWVIVFGPPLYLAADYLFERLHSKKKGHHASQKQFSAVSILAIVIIVLLAVGVFGAPSCLQLPRP